MHKFNRGLAAVATAVLTTSMATACAGSNGAENSAETPQVTIGVGGLTNLHNVPLVVADERGLFEDHGVEVELLDLQSGSKAVQGLVSGSVDVAAGFFDHTIQMQAKGKDLASFAVLSTSPGAVLAVSPKTEMQIDEFADLDGATVGVTSPGSGSDFFLRQVLDSAGLTPSDVTIVGIGSGSTAVAAMENGQVDAAFMYEPAFSQMASRAGDLTVLADMRTSEGVQQVLGTDVYPSEVLYTSDDWLDENPKAAAGVAGALKEALGWMAEQPADRVAAEVPARLKTAEADFYSSVLEDSEPMFSQTGLMPDGAPEANLDLLSQNVEEVSAETVDLSDTYTNEFVK